MISLFNSAAAQAVSDAVRSRGSRDGLPAAELERIEEHTRKVILPLFDGFGLEPQQIGELVDRALHLAIEKAAGRLTEAKVAAWTQLAADDLRAQGLSPARIKQVRQEAAQRLWDEKRPAYEALMASHPLARHPRVSRMVTDWHTRRTAEDATKSRQGRYIKADRTARGDGLLSGHPPTDSVIAHQKAIVRAAERTPASFDDAV